LSSKELSSGLGQLASEGLPLSKLCGPALRACPLPATTARTIMPTIKVRKQAALLQLTPEQADHEARARKHCVT
jgi:hypothetical protein